MRESTRKRIILVGNGIMIAIVLFLFAEVVHTRTAREQQAVNSSEPLPTAASGMERKGHDGL